MKLEDELGEDGGKALNTSLPAKQIQAGIYIHPFNIGWSFLLAILFASTMALAKVNQESIVGALGSYASPQQIALVVKALYWMALTNLGSLLVKQLSARRILSRTGRPAPGLLLNFIVWVIWVISGALIITFVLNRSITGILTASSVVVAVIGFALRSMIADLFYGISMALERPFEIGDWIRIGEDKVGEVREFSWRTTTLRTKEEISIVLPNNLLANSSFRNYSRPTTIWRTSFQVTLDYSVTAYEVERVMLSAVRQVPETATIDKTPKIRIIEFDLHGILWEIQFWVPDYPSSSKVIYEVQRAALRNLHFAGITVPRKKTEFYVETLRNKQETEEDNIRNWLHRIDLFRPLPAEEKMDLQERAKPQLFLESQRVVVQHEEGDSLFVLQQGTLRVDISIGANAFSTVAKLRPGDVFGEMSLLTGARRSASVTAETDSIVYEISKSELESVIHRHPNLIEEIGTIVAARQDSNKVLSDSERSDADASLNQASIAAQLIRNMKKFFGLSSSRDPK
jgi:small-conductance mechanosensitive channel/CRP-like cAMP-binding protein